MNKYKKQGGAKLLLSPLFSGVLILHSAFRLCSAAPAEHTLNLSIADSNGVYQLTPFPVAGHTNHFLKWDGTEWLLAAGAGGGSSDWGDIGGTLTDQADLVAALALKAPLASPTFTGTVTLPNSTVTNAMLAGSITAAKLVGTDITTVGTITSGTWSGNFGAVSGANLTALTAANITNSTTVGRNVLNLTNPSAISFIKIAADNTVSARTPVQVVSDLSLVAIATSGSASDLTTGTIPDARFPATLPALNGSALTNLNGTNIASGTVAVARLPASLGGLGAADDGLLAKFDADGGLSATDALFLRNGSNFVKFDLNGLTGENAVQLTMAGLALLDDANAAAQRTTLGLFAIASSGSATDLASGTIPDARFPATLPAASGANLTALNGENVQDDTIDDDSLDFGTGADQISAADIPIADTGAIFAATDAEAALLELAKVPVKVTAGSYTVGTTDPRELYGGVIYVTSTGTITVPAVASGASFTVITIGAIAVHVDPNAADLIYLDGTALSDGDKITNTSTAGDIAVLTYFDGTGWYASTNGWTDGN